MCTTLTSNHSECAFDLLKTQKHDILIDMSLRTPVAEPMGSYRGIFIPLFYTLFLTYFNQYLDMLSKMIICIVD